MKRLYTSNENKRVKVSIALNNDLKRFTTLKTVGQEKTITVWPNTIFCADIRYGDSGVLVMVEIDEIRDTFIPGLKSLEDFFMDWDILDRRVLIEKKGCL